MPLCKTLEINYVITIMMSPATNWINKVAVLCIVLYGIIVIMNGNENEVEGENKVKLKTTQKAKMFQDFLHKILYSDLNLFSRLLILITNS